MCVHLSPDALCTCMTTQSTLCVCRNWAWIKTHMKKQNNLNQMTEASIQVNIRSEGNIATCASRQLWIFMHMHVLFCSQFAHFSVFLCGVPCGFACFKQKFEETNSQTKRLYYTAVLLFVCVCVCGDSCTSALWLCCLNTIQTITLTPKCT